MPETSTLIPLEITSQPDETTCGPACLHAVYRHFGDEPAFEDVLRQTESLPEGGTLAVMLARHAIEQGYDATIYTCNLHMFDPTWFQPGAPPLAEKLAAQIVAKPDLKLQAASQAYIDFLAEGGDVRMQDITGDLLADMLDADTPIIAGLSATWLYQCARDIQKTMKPDDVAGEPTGHFVIVRGVDRDAGVAHIADPYIQNPLPGKHYYDVSIDRLISSVMLGIVTYDAKLLAIAPTGRNG